VSHVVATPPASTPLTARGAQSRFPLSCRYDHSVASKPGSPVVKAQRHRVSEVSESSASPYRILSPITIRLLLD